LTADWYVFCDCKTCSCKQALARGVVMEVRWPRRRQHSRGGAVRVVAQQPAGAIGRRTLPATSSMTCNFFERGCTRIHSH
jgi:hypothetical protein